MSAIRKSEFARECNVSAPCVSQWISGGKIDGAAIVGEGRSAMIDVDLARAQVKERRAVNESCGLNGLNTKLDDAPARRPGPALPNVGEDVVETSPDHTPHALGRTRSHEHVADPPTGEIGVPTPLYDDPARRPEALPNVGGDVVETTPPEELKAPILAGKGEPAVRVIPEGETEGTVEAGIKVEKLRQARFRQSLCSACAWVAWSRQATAP